VIQITPQFEKSYRSDGHRSHKSAKDAVARKAIQAGIVDILRSHARGGDGPDVVIDNPAQWLHEKATEYLKLRTGAVKTQYTKGPLSDGK
jgi:hypothetical protein